MLGGSFTRPELRSGTGTGGMPFVDRGTTEYCSARLVEEDVVGEQTRAAAATREAG